MSALYDSELFDNEDMAKAYSNSFQMEKQTLQITVTTILSYLSGIAPYDQASPFEHICANSHSCQMVDQVRDGSSSDDLDHCVNERKALSQYS